MQLGIVTGLHNSGHPKKRVNLTPFLAVVALVTPLKLLIINSKPTVFQASQPDAMRTLVQVSPSQYGFLHHTSYIVCQDLFGEYGESEVVDLFLAQPEIYKGRLDESTMEAVGLAFENNKYIPRKISRQSS